eukprot:jgi/Orpsp1_1/1182568/evm.model.c7180000081811.1
MNDYKNCSVNDYKNYIKTSIDTANNKSIPLLLLCSYTDFMKSKNNNNNNRNNRYNRYNRNNINHVEENENNNIINDENDLLNQCQLSIIYNTKLPNEEKIILYKKLLELGVNINLKIRDINNTCITSVYPLCLITDLKNNFLLTKFLIEQGADINLALDGNRRLLMFSIYNNDVDLVNYVLDLGVDLNNYDDGYSPLSEAILNYYNISIIKSLLDHGIDPNTTLYNRKVDSRQSVFLYAVLYRNIELIKLLMNYKASIVYNYKNDYYKFIESLRHEELIENGIDLVHYIKKNSLTIVNFKEIKELIIDNRLDLIKILVESDLMDINRKDEEGNTPLLFALKNDKIRTVKYFIKCQADLQISNNKGESFDSLCKKHRCSFEINENTCSKRMKLQ